MAVTKGRANHENQHKSTSSTADNAISLYITFLISQTTGFEHHNREIDSICAEMLEEFSTIVVNLRALIVTLLVSYFGN